MWVRDRSRSLKVAPVDRPHNGSAVVIIALSFTIFELLDGQNIVTLKSRLGVFEGHWKWHNSIDGIHEFLLPSIVTAAVSRTVSERKRNNISRKTPIFHTP